MPPPFLIALNANDTSLVLVSNDEASVIALYDVTSVLRSENGVAPIAASPLSAGAHIVHWQVRQHVRHKLALAARANLIAFLTF